jgi:hypothetical protein
VFSCCKNCEEFFFYFSLIDRIFDNSPVHVSGNTGNSDGLFPVNTVNTAFPSSSAARTCGTKSVRARVLYDCVNSMNNYVSSGDDGDNCDGRYSSNGDYNNNNNSEESNNDNNNKNNNDGNNIDNNHNNNINTERNNLCVDSKSDTTSGMRCDVDSVDDYSTVNNTEMKTVNNTEISTLNNTEMKTVNNTEISSVNNKEINTEICEEKTEISSQKNKKRKVLHNSGNEIHATVRNKSRIKSKIISMKSCLWGLVFLEKFE